MTLVASRNGGFLEPRLAEMLVLMDGVAGQRFAAAGFRWPGLRIISGNRSPKDQARVNPAIPNSLHVRCPSLAADLRVGQVAPSITPEQVWSFLGDMWKLMGGRWGGDFKDRLGQLTHDDNHFDLGFSGRAI